MRERFHDRQHRVDAGLVLAVKGELEVVRSVLHRVKVNPHNDVPIADDLYDQLLRAEGLT